jgi:hypothetical protein
MSHHLLLLAACMAAPPGDAAPSDWTPAMQRSADANTRFTCRMLGSAENRTSTLCFSPLGLFAALAMVADVDDIGRLRYLELLMIRGCTDLGPVASVPTPQFLFRQALKNVKTILSLAGLPVLRRIHLETMKGLTDLRPVAEAPALEDLVVIDMPQLSAEAFRPFVGKPSLRRAHVGVGRFKTNKAVEEMLNLPTAGWEFRFEDRSGSG